MLHFLGKRLKKRIYLDFAAATPIRREVSRVMRKYEREQFGNASAIHREGQVVRRAVEATRKEVAEIAVLRPEEITFTSGGTESNNLAIVGVVNKAVADGRNIGDIEIIATKIEHPSVLETLKVLQARGVTVRYASVDTDGRIEMKSFAKLLSEKTLLVTFAYVNSEIGVVQDVKRLTRIVREYKKETGMQQLYVHLDASQAPLWLPCRMDSLGIDLMTLDGGKMYGPKGVGVLLHRRSVPIAPYLHGGDQESGLRAGTEDAGRIVGFAKAFQIAQEGYEERVKRVADVRDYGIKALTENIEGCELNGSSGHRVANNINVSIKGIDGEYAVVVLDEHGVAASTRSACEGGSGSGSHVVAAISDDKRAASTVRLTLGEQTTKRDIERACTILRNHVLHMRRTIAESNEN